VRVLRHGIAVLSVAVLGAWSAQATEAWKAAITSRRPSATCAARYASSSWRNVSGGLRPEPRHRSVSRPKASLRCLRTALELGPSGLVARDGQGKPLASRAAVPARDQRAYGDQKLNPIIRGWVACYRTQVSSELFNSLDHYLWELTLK
jgi:Group II intron, maturase-specific domain